MGKEQVQIKSRKGENISILIEGKKNKGIVVLMQGMGEVKEELCIQTIAQSFRDRGYTTVRFDTAYTCDKDLNNFENFTTSNYYESLEDVIKWIRKREWYKEPISMVGHSLGGLCSILYAEKHPTKVKAIFPVSTTISSKLSLETFSPELLIHWEKEGILEWEDQGILKRLKWDFITDSLQFDVLLDIDKLTMPVFMISAENDTESPLTHQGILYNKISGKKYQTIIRGAPHKIQEQNHLEEIKDAYDEWKPKLEPSNL
jgi:esterase/lipase